MHIEGNAFPIGRTAHVRLEGVLHRPGHPTRAIDEELEGTSISAERIEVPMPDQTLRGLGGRGTFRGRIEVSFGSGAVDGQVLGSIDGVAVDLVPDQPMPGDAAARAVRFAEEAGLEVEVPEDGGLGGLAITLVAPGSPAERAGLVPGDRLIEVEGMRLLAPEELAPLPGTRHFALAIARDGIPGTVAASLELDDGAAIVSSERVRVGQLAALVLLLAFALIGPGARFLDRLAPARLSRAALMIGIATGLAAAALRAGLEWAPSIGLEVPLFGAIAARAATMVLAADGTRARLGAIARVIAGALGAAALLAATTLAIGSTSPDEIELAQGPWPWEWTALRSPLGPLALALALALGSCGPRAPSARTRAIDDALLIPIAIVVAIGALGGAGLVDRLAEIRPSLAALGYAPFAIAAALIAAALRRVRDRAEQVPSIPLAIGTIALAAVTTASAALWLELEVPPPLQQAIGEVITVTMVLLATRIAIQRTPRPGRPGYALL